MVIWEAATFNQKANIDVKEYGGKYAWLIATQALNEQ